MIVDVLYSGTSIVNGNTVSENFKNQEKEIIERIKTKKIAYYNLSQSFKDAFMRKNKVGISQLPHTEYIQQTKV